MVRPTCIRHAGSRRYAPRVIVLAHPLTESELGVSPLALATAVVLVLAVVVLRWPRATPQEPREAHRSGRAESVGRAAAVGLLLLAVAAGRFGEDDQLANIAPALVVGFGWPLVLALQLCAGDVWARVNPFDTLARLLDRLAGRSPSRPLPGGRWWAVGPAFAWVWYLGIYDAALEPRAVALALAGYAILTLAACQVVGRASWLADGEVFTVLFTMTAQARRRGRPLAPSPPGTWAVLGVLAGGLLFAMLRFSQLWILQLSEAGIDPLASSATVPGMVVLAAVFALGYRFTVAAAMAPVVAGLGLALAMARDRLFTSAVLVVARASNPFGGEMDLFGTADLAPHSAPLGLVGRAAAQVAVLLVAGVVAGLAARRTNPEALPRALVAIGASTFLGVLTVTAV